MGSRLLVRSRGSDATSRGHRSIATATEHDQDSWLPTIDELTVPSSRVRPTKPIIRLASCVAALAAVVGVGLVGRDVIGPGPMSGLDPAASLTGPVEAPSTTGGTGPSSQRTRPRLVIVILLPGPGDVVLGSVVPVAGSVAVSGAPRGVSKPGDVRVTISAGGAILGEATLPLVDGRYVGWVRVVAPARGVIADIRVQDPRLPGREASSREFVLQAGSSGGGPGSQDARISSRGRSGTSLRHEKTSAWRRSRLSRRARTGPARWRAGRGADR